MSIPRTAQTGIALIILGLVALAFILLLLSGCGSKPIVAPSTAGVQGSINSASGNVAAASEANKSAQRYNDLARGRAGRIDAKTSVIEKYWGK